MPRLLARIEGDPYESKPRHNEGEEAAERADDRSWPVHLPRIEAHDLQIEHEAAHSRPPQLPHDGPVRGEHGQFEIAGAAQEVRQEADQHRIKQQGRHPDPEPGARHQRVCRLGPRRARYGRARASRASRASRAGTRLGCEACTRCGCGVWGRCGCDTGSSRGLGGGLDAAWPACARGAEQRVDDGAETDQPQQVVGYEAEHRHHVKQQHHGTADQHGKGGLAQRPCRGENSLQHLRARLDASGVRSLGACYPARLSLGESSQPSTRAINSLRLRLPVLSSMLFMWSWTVDDVIES